MKAKSERLEVLKFALSVWPGNVDVLFRKDRVCPIKVGAVGCELQEVCLRNVQNVHFCFEKSGAFPPLLFQTKESPTSKTYQKQESHKQQTRTFQGCLGSSYILFNQKLMISCWENKKVCPAWGQVECGGIRAQSGQASDKFGQHRPIRPGIGQIRIDVERPDLAKFDQHLPQKGQTWPRIDHMWPQIRPNLFRV